MSEKFSRSIINLRLLSSINIISLFLTSLYIRSTSQSIVMLLFVSFDILFSFNLSEYSNPFKPLTSVFDILLTRKYIQKQNQKQVYLQMFVKCKMLLCMKHFSTFFI
jgi:hypothetical protein